MKFNSESDLNKYWMDLRNRYQELIEKSSPLNGIEQVEQRDISIRLKLIETMINQFEKGNINVLQKEIYDENSPYVFSEEETDSLLKSLSIKEQIIHVKERLQELNDLRREFDKENIISDVLRESEYYIKKLKTLEKQ